MDYDADGDREESHDFLFNLSEEHMARWRWGDGRAQLVNMQPAREPQIKGRGAMRVVCIVVPPHLNKGDRFHSRDHRGNWMKEGPGGKFAVSTKTIPDVKPFVVPDDGAKFLYINLMSGAKKRARGASW